MGYIYLITNIVNGKKYVGQTLCKDIETRWKQHKNKNDKSIGPYLCNAYNKYGVDKFKFQVICVCFDEDCNDFETDYIKKYNCLVPNGYNLKEGGKNSKHHPETIKKITDTLKGRVLGVRTEETSRKLRENHLGEKNPNYGKKMSDEQKKKISDTRKKLWNNNQFSEESRQKQIEGLNKGRISKKVGKYDLNENFIASFNSISEAAENVKLPHSSISKVCRGVKSCKTAGGFVS